MSNCMQLWFLQIIWWVGYRERFLERIIKRFICRPIGYMLPWMATVYVTMKVSHFADNLWHSYNNITNITWCMTVTSLRDIFIRYVTFMTITYPLNVLLQVQQWLASGSLSQTPLLPQWTTRLYMSRGLHPTTAPRGSPPHHQGAVRSSTHFSSARRTTLSGTGPHR